MFLLIILWLAFFFLVFELLFPAMRTFGLLAPIAVVAVLFFALFFFSLHRLTSPRRAAAKYARKSGSQPAAPSRSSVSSADSSGSVTFRVAGVTFANDDGTERQDILRHIKFGDSPYANGIDPDDLSITVEETIFDGDTAFEVWANGYQIGYVPKTKISQVENALSNVATCSVSEAHITGGGTDSVGHKINYGCTVTLTF